MQMMSKSLQHDWWNDDLWLSMTADHWWLQVTDNSRWGQVGDHQWWTVMTNDREWGLVTVNGDWRLQVMLLLTDHSRWSVVSFTHQWELMTAGDGSCWSWWQRDVTARGSGDIRVVACLTRCYRVPYSRQFCDWLHSCSSPRGEGHSRVQGMVYLHLHEN